jgi:hypothetical protein
MKDRVALIASAVLLIALVWIVYDRGGPYFERPLTVVDHEFRTKIDLRDPLIVLPQVRPLLPRGAKVACFRPLNGKWQDDTASFHTAVAALPQQLVVPAYAASEDIPRQNMADYVVAIDEPFTNPAYRLEAQFPAGRLYKVMR